MCYLRFSLVLIWSFMAMDGICLGQQLTISQTNPAGSAMEITRDTSSQQHVAPDAMVVNPSPAAVVVHPFKAKVTHVTGVSDQDSLRLRLGDYVKLEVKLLSKAMKLNGGLRPDQLRLFVDDIALTKVPPYSADTTKGIIIFPLNRNLASEPFWRVFYHFPTKYEHPGHLGIGSEIAQIALSYPTKGEINIVLIRKRQLFVGLGLVITFGILLYWLGRQSLLIKEDWSDQYNPQISDVSKVQFSLSKLQLVFWTFLIISGYFIIWLVTGELPTIPESILALLGISLSEKILGKGINFRQDQINDQRVQDKPSAGLFQDILSDENGVSIARLQFVLFNLVIGLSFIRNIIKNWSLMDIDTSSLVLLTISGAGYLIVKNTENSNPLNPNLGNLNHNNPNPSGPNLENLNLGGPNPGV